jgi:hypothetical protein
MSAPYPNSQRPAGGQIVGVYFTADELAALQKLVDRTGEKRNAVIRRLVREAA